MSRAQATTESTAPSHHGRVSILLAVGVSAFITGLDNTILNIALPALQADFGLSLTGLQWVGTSYILAFSSLLLVGGRLTDIFGARRVLEAGLITFIISSVMAGLAPNEQWLIAARVIQGIGGAMVLPSTLAIIGTDLHGEDRHLGIGVWTACIAIAIALGPIVGGGIISVAHWSWVFLINVPLGLLCIVLSRRAVGGARLKLPPRPELVAKLDIPGLVLASVVLFGITFYLVHGQDYGFGSIVGLAALGISALSTIVFIQSEKRTAYPLLDLALFRNRIYSGGVVVQLLWGLGINGILFFMSPFLQDIVGLDPFDAALYYVPLALSIAVTVPVGAKLAMRIGVNHTVAIGMVLIAVGLLHGVFVDHEKEPLRFLIGLVVVGLGSGLTTPMASAVMDVIPRNHEGQGAAVVSTAREISGIVGIVGIGAVLVVRRSAALADGASADDAFVAGFHLALVAATVIMAIGAVLAYFTLTRKHEAVAMAEEKAAAEAALAAEHDAGDEIAGVLEATTPGDFAIALAEAHDIVHADDSSKAAS
ncbi:MAG: MFS transporter [Patulibacter minatonensis]